MSLFDQPSGVAPRPKRASRPKAKPAGKPTLADLPAHVLAKLADLGAVDVTIPGRPVTRKAHMDLCVTCHRPVMCGLLSMPTPFTVIADPPAVDAQGEALALLQGLRTYSLSWHYDRYELDYRGDWDLLHKRRGAGIDILVEHRCDMVAHWPPVASVLPPLRPFLPTQDADADVDAPPPF